jgi:hypothetical protein
MSHIRSQAACVGKLSYVSRQEAAHDLRNKRPAGNIKPYRCTLCGQWHVGHKLKKKDVGPKKERP